MDYESFFSRVDACRNVRWELTSQLRSEIALMRALVRQSRASVASTRSRVAQSRERLTDSYQLLQKVNQGSLAYGYASPRDGAMLPAQPTAAEARLHESIVSLAAQPALECVVVDENVMAPVAQSPTEDARLTETLLALAAQLTLEDRARCADCIDLLIAARGDELAHRALRPVTELEDMITILKRRLTAGRR